jgi:hypothetical protein
MQSNRFICLHAISVIFFMPNPFRPNQNITNAYVINNYNNVCLTRKVWMYKYIYMQIFTIIGHSLKMGNILILSVKNIYQVIKIIG